MFWVSQPKWLRRTIRTWNLAHPVGAHRTSCSRFSAAAASDRTASNSFSASLRSRKSFSSVSASTLEPHRGSSHPKTSLFSQPRVLHFGCLEKKSWRLRQDGSIQLYANTMMCLSPPPRTSCSCHPLPMCRRHHPSPSPPPL